MIDLHRTKILLISNYRPDTQYSMLRFSDLLLSFPEVDQNHCIKEIFPKPILGKLQTNAFFSKWYGYIDKYIVFSFYLFGYLLKTKKQIDLIHIADHSNSVYLGIIKKIVSCKTLVTCHDFIAIRSAKGAFGNLQQTSITGKLLQKWILSSLVKADFYACDSLQTEKDLKKLLPRSQNRSCVIHLGTRDQKNVQENSDTQIYLSRLPFDPSQTDYLLHVGNDAWYKNRKSLFNLLKEISNSTEYQDVQLVVVGPPPQKHELNSSTANFLHTNPNKLIVLENLSDIVLEFLYQHAKVFVFPSFIEGFGWPPLEAALSNCPVVTSRTGALFDILKESANYIDPYNQDSINSTVRKILQKNARTANKLNIPSLSECTSKYYKLYHQLAN